MIRASKDENVKNQNVKKNIESQKMTFDVLIFFEAIGNIRTSKVLVHFLAKNTFDVLILPMASEKIRTSKIKKINYLWCITYVYQGLWGVRLGSSRLGQVRLSQVRLGQVKTGQKVFLRLIFNAKMPQVLTPQVVDHQKSVRQNLKIRQIRLSKF